MRKYTVKSLHTSYDGQFEKRRTPCIALVRDFLVSRPCRCYLGTDKNNFYDMDYERALSIMDKYGKENVVRVFKGRVFLILPLKEFRYGKHRKKKVEVIPPAPVNKQLYLFP